MTGGLHRVIQVVQLFAGRELTFPIGQDNSYILYCPGRFRRRTRVASRCSTMVDLLLRLLHHLQQPAIFAE